MERSFLMNKPPLNVRHRYSCTLVTKCKVCKVESKHSGYTFDEKKRLFKSEVWCVSCVVKSVF